MPDVESLLMAYLAGIVVGIALSLAFRWFLEH